MIREAARHLFIYLDDLVTKNAGEGRSVQSFMYLIAGIGIIASAVCMAMAASAVGIYAAVSPLIFAILAVPIGPWPGIKCTSAPLDTVFWGAFFVCLGGTWTAALGYITSAKKNSTNATKEVVMAKLPQPVVPLAPTVTSTEVSAIKTVSGPAPKKK